MSTHETYVRPATAKMLREAGFDWEQSSVQTDVGVFHDLVTLAVAQKWLIEVKGYLVESVLCANRKNRGNSFGFSITSISSDLSECRMVYPRSYYDEEESKDFMKYEYALEAGIQDCLNRIIEGRTDI